MGNATARWWMALALIAVFTVSTRPAEAGVTTFTSSADFNTAIAGYTTSIENYGSLIAGTTISAGDTIDGLTYSAFTAGPFGSLVRGIVTDQFGSFTGNSLGGNQSGGAQYFFGGDSVTIDFAAPVSAFGLFFNVNANSGEFGFTTSVGTALTGSTSFDTSTFVFAGLVSTDASFTSATFFSTDANVGSYNVPEIITAASSVPEPSSLLLASIGLASCAAWTERRRRIGRRAAV